MKKVTNTIILFAFLFSGIVYAQEQAEAKVFVCDLNDQPIAGAQILFFDTEEKVVADGVSDAEGNLEVKLSAGLYNIRLKSVSNTRDYAAIQIPVLKEREVYNDVQIVVKYEEETTFVLSDLHFETAKSIIKEDSYGLLDELVSFLKVKSSIRIEIAGHTDSDGASNSNLTLSQARATAVKDYLVSKGISGTRLTAKGYGETKPIESNETEAGKAMNRRTEIYIQ